TWHPSTRFEWVSDRQNCRVITLLQPGSFNLDDEHAPVPTKVERPSKSQYTSFSVLIHGWEECFPAVQHAGLIIYKHLTVRYALNILAKCCVRSEEHTSELQSRFDLVCRLLL